VILEIFKMHKLGILCL